MMIALVIAVATATIACESTSVDVIARPIDAASVADGGNADAPEPAAIDLACPNGRDASFVVMTKSSLRRIDLATNAITADGLMPCLAIGQFGLAMDRGGNIWATTTDGAFTIGQSTTGACARLEARIPDSVMAFVYDPRLNRESLIALIGKEVVAFDPATLEKRVLGKTPFDVIRGLAGTPDGRLFAFAEMPSHSALVTIAELSRIDASIVSSTEVESPYSADRGRLVGGLPRADDGGFELLFGGEMFGFTKATGTLELRRRWISSTESVTAIATSPCFLLSSQ